MAERSSQRLYTQEVDISDIQIDWVLEESYTLYYIFQFNNVKWNKQMKDTNTSGIWCDFNLNNVNITFGESVTFLASHILTSLSNLKRNTMSSLYVQSFKTLSVKIMGKKKINEDVMTNGGHANS